MTSMVAYMKYLVEECYEEDYNPFFAEDYYDNYCFEYSFSEWYFLHRKRFRYHKTKTNRYKWTPDRLLIGEFTPPLPSNHFYKKETEKETEKETKKK